MNSIVAPSHKNFRFELELIFKKNCISNVLYQYSSISLIFQQIHDKNNYVHKEMFSHWRIQAGDAGALALRHQFSRYISNLGPHNFYHKIKPFIRLRIENLPK